MSEDIFDPLASSRDVYPIPAAPRIGIELDTLPLANLGEKDFSKLYTWWLQHSVILIRDQRMSDEQLIAFSRRFGDLDWAPVQETGRRVAGGMPELYVVSNVVENGEPIGSLGSGEAVWHTDMSYTEIPPKASILYALEVPATGGDTSFVDMVAVLRSLPEDLTKRINGIRVKHDGTYNSGGYVREGIVPGDDPRTAPGALHPLVYTHPETGVAALYLGRRRNAYIDGLDLESSEALLDELWSYVDNPDLQWRHQWRAGDLVLWDNRSTMHRRDSFDAGSRRVLHRTQVKGTERPA